MLASIPQLAKANELPVIVGGDFNLTPGQIHQCGVLRKAGLDCLAPDRGTCITGSWKGASTIDMFIVTTGLQAALGRPEALLGQKLATHRPVRLSMASHTQPQFFKRLAPPPRLPTSRPVGPAPKEPTQWDAAEIALDRAYEAAKAAAADPSKLPAALEAQRAAYRRVGDAADLELQNTLQIQDDTRETSGKSQQMRTWGFEWKRCR